MADDSPLLRLPEITMNHILYFCDYREIARLRKVCHTLRNHIDLSKPNAHVREVVLGNSDNGIEIFFESDNDSDMFIAYKEAERGCTVETITIMGRSSLKTISGLGPMDALIQDFKIYLRHLKTPLMKFILYEVCCDPLHQIMESQPLESRSCPLKVDALELHGLSMAQILATLPLFNANHLKDLTIKIDKNAITNGDGLNDHALFETEHWKNAERVILTANLKIMDVRQMTHLKEFEGSISRMTTADVEFLKNTLISSPLLEQCFTIVVDVEIDLLSLTETFGTQSIELDGGGIHLWYFHIPNDTNSLLLLKVIGETILEFERINRSRVFTGAVIIY